MSENIHDNAALYSVNALPPEEAAAFESHLESCADCRGEVAEMRSITADMTSVEPIEPPAALRRNVLETIEQTPQEHNHHAASPWINGAMPEPEVAQVIDLTSRRRLRVLALAAAVATIVVLAIGGIALSDQGSEFDQIANQSDAMQLDLSGDGPGVVSLTWSESTGQFAAVAEMLPLLPEFESYELWIFNGDEPVSAAVFLPDASGRFEIIGDLNVDPSTFAVTVEPDDGNPEPTGPIVFAEPT